MSCESCVSINVETPNLYYDNMHNNITYLHSTALKVPKLYKKNISAIRIQPKAAQKNLNNDKCVGMCSVNFLYQDCVQVVNYIFF